MIHLKHKLYNLKYHHEKIDDVHDDIVADIRNKLSPIQNLVALIENDAPKEYILKQLEQVKISIKYLSDK